eukprot:7378922-Prymnesium_polylepis.2
MARAARPATGRAGRSGWRSRVPCGDANHRCREDFEDGSAHSWKCTIGRPCETKCEWQADQASVHLCTTGSDQFRTFEATRPLSRVKPERRRGTAGGTRGPGPCIPRNGTK